MRYSWFLRSNKECGGVTLLGWTAPGNHGGLPAAREAASCVRSPCAREGAGGASRRRAALPPAQRRAARPQAVTSRKHARRLTTSYHDITHREIQVPRRTASNPRLATRALLLPAVVITGERGSRVGSNCFAFSDRICCPHRCFHDTRINNYSCILVSFHDLLEAFDQIIKWNRYHSSF